MSKRLYFHIPTIKELDYRQKILAQPNTMSYNKGYNLGFDNYDNETGCINFKNEYWNDWFNRWVNKEPDRYYAYIIKIDKNIPIGEVSLCYDNAENAYCVNIVIEAKYRGYGYSEEALRLLIYIAFHTFGGKKVFDEFPDTRATAEKVFKKVGFKRTSVNIVELTREDYFNLEKNSTSF